MKLADGVSGHLDSKTGKVRVMWRNREQLPDGSVKTRQKKLTVDSEKEARRVAIEISDALTQQGYWDPKGKPARPLDEDLDEMFAAHGAHKLKVEGRTPRTVEGLVFSFKRFVGGIRTIEGMPETASVPCRMLNLPTYHKVVAWLATEANGGEGYSTGTTYLTCTAVLDAWSWAADQQEEDGSPKWVTLPRPPYNRKALLPATPSYQAPSRVASWEELDEVINRIRGPKRATLAVVAKWITVIQRYTGLRLYQAVGIYREDFDLERKTLVVRRGKSKREKAMMREMAVSKHLLDDLAPMLPESGPLFPDGRDPTVPIVAYRNTTKHVTRAWEDAEDKKAVRKGLRLPPGRDRPSPTHAYRTAFQQHLQDAGVSVSVLDYLVGHAEGSTRARHYTRPSMKAQQAAVNLIPAIQWKEEE